MSMIGKTLGHYSVSTLIGRGGMGEVYQAKDQKLGRDVAIKILPEEFAKDTERVARFQREAKLLASLNHPNIAAIHGLEESDDTQFLVLELVEGDTLADQLKHGAIPVEEALKLALQIAEALEAAHEKGVIHRDLKPANIKVTPDGKAKVLDFGLAKAYAGEQEEVDLSHSPTLSDAATQQGVILGTAAYMSPEQARGEAVDRRADIWAFGCVLYEMLTGRAAFEGRSVSDVLASVLKSEPEWKSLPPNLHPRIRLLLDRCLEKEVKNRYSNINDPKVDLQRVTADPSGVLMHTSTLRESRTKLQTILPWVAAIILTATIVGVIIWNLKPTPLPESRQVSRFYHELPEEQQFSDTSLAVSPDGSQFVYCTAKGLYLRSVDELNARLIPGTDENARRPFFSPDGKWVGYYSVADSQLKKIAISGGAPIALCSVVHFLGASWCADNTIVYGRLLGGIMRVSDNGGTPESLVKGAPYLPQLLPDGKSMLFTDVSVQPNKVIVQSLGSGEQKELIEGSGATYLPTGHLVYGMNNDIFAIPFNLETLDVLGEPVLMIENVAEYATSYSGTLAYIPRTASDIQPGRTLMWVDCEGREELLKVPCHIYRYPKISPDGTKVALTVSDELNMELWIWDLVRETLTRLTFDEAYDLMSVWTPDSKRIVFSSTRDDEYFGVYWKAADGIGEVELLCSVPGQHLLPFSLSSDGKTLLMAETPDAATIFDIATLSMEGDRSRKRLLQQEEYRETQPMISPDGRWMAYACGEGDKSEIYVRPFPDINKGRWQVSTGGGDSPLWSADSRELFYLNDDAVVAVSVETEPAFSFAAPRILFRGNYVGSYPIDGTPWDIHPDGKRFLMMKESETTDDESTMESPRKINIVLNWFEELKDRVPVD